MPSQSLVATSQTPAPAANSVMTQISAANLVPGTWYLVKATVYIGGTGAADGTDNDNIKIVVNNVSVGGAISYPVNGVGTMTIVYQQQNNINNIKLQSILAASVGTIYHGNLVATPLDSVEGLVPTA